MYEALRQRADRLARAGCGPLLRAGLKGIEKECLRVSPEGALAATAHPDALGSALTHPSLTTDYSEALLEFVTPPFAERAEVLEHLGGLHRFVLGNIDGELLWATSMPCHIAGDEAIPIARYGTSNSGRLRHLYRVGLGHRYGRMMQMIAGVHFNYSFAADLWPALLETGAAHGPVREWLGTGRALADAHYFGLIRNLFRHGWLLLYLFGASPALPRSFLPDGHAELEALDAHTWHAPFATSLRMGAIGYTNRIPGGIGIRYDDLYGYAASLYRAITTPHPQWEALGLRDEAGDYLQLNTNLLQMENEYYSSVRPKQPTRRGERPTEALQRRGVRYVELRTLDLDPFSPVGLTAERMQFLEVFMLFCLLQDSPVLSAAEGRAIDTNQERVAVRGRDPELKLLRPDGSEEVTFRAWANELLGEMTGLAELLDGANEPGSAVAAVAAVAAAKDLVREPDATPSARMLAEMRAGEQSFLDYALELSRRHRDLLTASPLAPPAREELERLASESRAAQAQLEADDTLNFDEYLERYFA